MAPEPLNVKAAPVPVDAPGAPTRTMLPLAATLVPNMSPAVGVNPVIASEICVGPVHPRQSPTLALQVTPRGHCARRSAHAAGRRGFAGDALVVAAATVRARGGVASRRRVRRACVGIDRRAVRASVDAGFAPWPIRAAVVSIEGSTLERDVGSTRCVTGFRQRRVTGHVCVTAFLRRVESRVCVGGGLSACFS